MCFLQLTVNLLIARLREIDDIASKVDMNNPEKICESCEENPSKLYQSAAAKWFCQDCKQYICNLCKDAHEKLKITRTHVITPYGTILELNIGNDLTFNPVHDEKALADPAVKDPSKFLDFTVSDEDDDKVDTGTKRKRADDDNNEEESDLNNSFELVYETPMAKIGYRGRKKIVLELIPETPCTTPPAAWTTTSPRPRTCPIFTNTSPLVASLQHDSQQIIPETPYITPPPVWTTPSPRPRTCPMFTNISPLDASMQHDSQQVSFLLSIFARKSFIFFSCIFMHGLLN